MAERKVTRVIIPLAGISTGDRNPRAIYDPQSVKVMAALGQVETKRASNVENGSALSQTALEILHHINPHYATTEPAALTATEPVYTIAPAFANHWFADMTPCGHHTVLGPYLPEDRERALREEVAWLQANNIPVCEPCVLNTPAGPQMFKNLEDIRPKGESLLAFAQHTETCRTRSDVPHTANLSRPAFGPRPPQAFVEADYTGVELKAPMLYMSADYAGMEERLKKTTFDAKRREAVEDLASQHFPSMVCNPRSEWSKGDDTFEVLIFTQPGEPSHKLTVEFEPGTDNVLYHDIVPARQPAVHV